MKLVHQQIQYIEFLSNDFGPVKDFYQAAFGWEFTDYGAEYTARDTYTSKLIRNTGTHRRRMHNVHTHKKKRYK